jgi:[CysO sulfur-carrier protein]-S-L-cysteine hydrolase
VLALRGGPPALIRAFPPEVLAEMIRHLVAAWPQEGCGVILQALEAGEGGTWRVVPMANASPTPRVAYAFAPEAWLQVCLEAESRREEVVCVFHSHVDASASFSAEDRRQAAPAGIPLLPQVSYIVVAIHGGWVLSASQSVWSAGDFRTVPLMVPDFRFEKAV